MTPLQFLTIINKYHFVTFVVVIFLAYGIYEAIEKKWGERGGI